MSLILVPTKDFVGMQYKSEVGLIENNTKGIEAAFFKKNYLTIWNQSLSKSNAHLPFFFSPTLSITASYIISLNKTLL